jgi:DNA-binding MarR family transcriptional regulator
LAETTVADRAALIERFITLKPALERQWATKVLPPDLQEQARSVTCHQIEALQHMGSNGLKMRDLARALDITDGSAAVLSERLVKQGLAERRPDPDDRRVVWLVPSARARAMSERFKQFKRESIVESLRGLDEPQLRALIEALERIAAAAPGACNS